MGQVIFIIGMQGQFLDKVEDVLPACRVAFHADVVLVRHVTHKNVCEAFERGKRFSVRERREGYPLPFHAPIPFFPFERPPHRLKAVGLRSVCNLVPRSLVRHSIYSVSRTMFLKEKCGLGCKQAVVIAVLR